MKRQKLHDVMRAILVDQPNRMMSLRLLAQEIKERDLYRCRDGSHPGIGQLYARRSKKRDLFEIVGEGIIRYVGTEMERGTR